MVWEYPGSGPRHLEGGTIKEVVEQQGRVHSTECNSNGQRIPELTERNIP